MKLQGTFLLRFCFVASLGAATAHASLVVKSTDADRNWFDGSGTFTPRGLAEFLERAYKNGAVQSPRFSSVSCMHAETGHKGSWTRQIFKLTSNCGGGAPQLFFVKEPSSVGAQGPEQEIYQLASLYGVPELQGLLLPNHKPGYPSLAAPVVFLKYGTHFLVVMPAAPGKRFDWYMDDYARSLADPVKKQASLARLTRAYRDLGEALSRFHQLFLKNGRTRSASVRHGDANQLNLFYDEATRQVTFIDLGSLFSFFKRPEMIFADFMNLLIWSFDLPHLHSPESGRLLTPQAWFGAVVPPLITAYVAAYPVSEQKAVMSELTAYLQSASGAHTGTISSLLAQVRKDLKL